MSRRGSLRMNLPPNRGSRAMCFRWGNVAVARKLGVIMHRIWVSGARFETGVEVPRLTAA